MKLSVIIPMYNLEEYIEKSIKSVLSQSFDYDFEIIVVDDGSNDNSCAIVEKICESYSNIKLIRQKNKGVSSARNSGINAACGKYIVFVDGDDILFIDALKTLVDMLDSDSNIILVSGKHKRITDYNFQPSQPQHSIESSEAKDVLCRILTEKYDVSACAKIFNRSLLADIRFVEGKRINEDKYFLFQYLLKNNGVVVDVNSYIYGYYVRNGSVTNSVFSEATLDMLHFSQAIDREIADLYPQLLAAARYNSIVTHLAVMKKIIRSKQYKQQKELFKKIRNQTIKISKTLNSDIENNHKLELLALAVGSYSYILCVRLFDFFKR